MTLPDVAGPLPEDISTPEAERVASFLQHHDRKATESAELTLYGSAAVILYLADSAEYNYGYTDDIDVGHMEPKNIDLSVDVDAVSPPLRFQTFDLERWLVHPDWASESVDVSALLELTNLHVALLHPVDLVITKLGRGAPQDIEDSLLLRDRYFPDHADPVAERTRKAWAFRPPTTRERRTIEVAFESIFEEPLKLNNCSR